MNHTKFHTASLVLSCGLALVALPAAFANGPSKVSEKFRSMDTNSDGRISRDEHATGAKQMFTEMDTNRDGLVTSAEMDAAHAQKDHKPAAAGQAAQAGQAGRAGQAEHSHAHSSADKISVIDQNADGRLTAAEHETGATKMFDKMDTNADGFLSQDEMAAGHKMMKKDKEHHD